MLSKIKSIPRKIWVIIILASVLKLIISAITYHADVVPWDLAGRVIGSGHILDFYDYLRTLPSSDIFVQNYPVHLFNYPPAIYFSTGVYTSVLHLLFPQPFLNDFAFNISKTFGMPLLWLYLLLLKLPFLIFDIAAGLLLWSFFQSQSQKKIALLLWMFNPINIYATYMMGQFDIIPTFFVIWSIVIISKQYSGNNNSPLLVSAFLLGLGSAFKIFPLLFLGPLMGMTKSWKTRAQILIVGFIPYIATLLPFLSSSGFRSNALVANQTLKSTYAQIPISGGEAIMLFIVLVLFFWLIFLLKSCRSDELWKRYFIMMIVFFVFTHYHPQWFLWITPFMIFDLAIHRLENIAATLLSLVSFFGLLLFFDPGLTVRLFSPIVPSLSASPGILSLLNLSLDEHFYRSLLQSVFVGSAIYYLYRYFPKEGSAT